MMPIILLRKEEHRTLMRHLSDEECADKKTIIMCILACTFTKMKLDKEIVKFFDKERNLK